MAGITSTKKIKGQPHLLAYITPNEVEQLKALGGQETMTPEGIPAYPPSDNYRGSSYSSKDKTGHGNTHSRFDVDSGYYGTPKGSTFETYRGDKNIGVDNTLKAKYGNYKDKKEAREALAQNNYYSPGPTQSPFERFNTYNTNFQKRQNIKLAKKRALQKFKDMEQYVDFDDYGSELTGQQMAEARGYTFDEAGNLTGYDRSKATDLDYGYDLSELEKGKEFLTSNKGTSIESTRPNLYDINPKTNYSLTTAILGNIRPDTEVTALNTLAKAGDYTALAVDPNISKEKLDALANRGKTPDQIDPPRDGDGGNQVYIPYNYEQILPEDEYEREQKEFAYRFGDTQNVGADVTRASYIFNQGGRVPASGGGIMNAVPRQGFFLGKIAKGIGKAVSGVAKAAGKVLKSDFGKAALIGLGGYYLGGGQMFGLRPSAPGFSFGNLGKSLFLKPGKESFSFANLDPLKMAGLITLGGAAMGPAKQDTLPGSERGKRLLDSQGNEALPADLRAEVLEAYESGDADKIAAINDYYNFLPGLNAVRLPDIKPYLPYPNYADGGRIKAQEGGLMDLGGMEKDYRNEGGFVPIGREEKADDVPARLSVNEFVFTADAVRNAGGGDIDKGAEVMENMMKNLENGGKVSEESQGNTGAQEMFSVSERIGEVI